MTIDLVSELLSYNQLHDLWGAGYTIVRRNPDPFEIDAKLIHKGVSYQWNPITADGLQVKQEGWRPVPYARHPGVFAPWGMTGMVTRDGLELCEKPQAVVDLHRGAAKAAAERQVKGWADKAAADGLTGFVNIGSQTTRGKLDNLTTLDVGGGKAQYDYEPLFRDGDDAVQIGATKTIETIVAIPKDMVAHMPAIFAERDKIEAEVVRKDRTLAPGAVADKFYEAIDANKAAPWWPTLRAIILPIAIDNVRAAIRSLEITHPEQFGKEPTDE